MDTIENIPHGDVKYGLDHHIEQISAAQQCSDVAMSCHGDIHH